MPRPIGTPRASVDHTVHRRLSPTRTAAASVEPPPCAPPESASPRTARLDPSRGPVASGPHAAANSRRRSVPSGARLQLAHLRVLEHQPVGRSTACMTVESRDSRRAVCETSKHRLTLPLPRPRADGHALTPSTRYGGYHASPRASTDRSCFRVFGKHQREAFGRRPTPTAMFL